VGRPAARADRGAALGGARREAARARERALTVELAVDDPRWARLVAESPEATAFHRPEWAALLADCYGYRTFVVADPDRRRGIPVAEVRRPLGGRRWVSLPFTDACPPVGGDPGLADAAQGAGVGRVEVHAPLAGETAWRRVEAVTHTLELEPDADAVRRRFSRSQVQRNIARAEREGVTVRRGEAAGDLTEIFYRLHLRTRRRQGVPVQPRRFFELLWERILKQGGGFVLVAETAGAPVAAAVFLTGNATVTYKYGASDPAAWGLRPNNLLFWEAIRWSCERGFARFDFGKTDLDNEGLRAFKSNWAAVEEPLEYTTLGAPPAAAGSGALQRRLGTVIRRSPPLVCRALGEALYKYAA
jgi:CelD/BcsL family acetyltransferase involved in cellulose biosynthesis